MRRGFINSMAHSFNLKGTLRDSSIETQKGTVHIITKPGKWNAYSTTQSPSQSLTVFSHC